MKELYLPVLSHFQNGNTWIASEGRLRFQITPAEDILQVEVWEGPWCYACSKVEEETHFSMDDNGLAQLRLWLGERARVWNAHPACSLSDELARRVEAKRSL